MATVRDTIAGGDVIVGDVVMATRGADPQMNRLLDCLKNMKSSQKLLVGKLREEEENNCENRRTVAHYERQAK